MDDTIETIERKYTTIKIYQDNFPESPREWDNLGTMVCWHNRYNLGDEHGFYSPEDFHDYVKENPVIVLPLYLYDHSGITINTSGFYCPWDSGQVGYIYVTKEQVRKEYGWKLITKNRIETIKKYLRNEVEIYDQYLRGDVYYFEVICNKCNEWIDSCGGFYGTEWDKNGLMDYVGDDQLCDDCQTQDQHALEMIMVGI